MRLTDILAVVAALVGTVGLTKPVSADPCGMVPPLLASNPDVIRRIGDQITYVFFKDGIETIVLRPGFTGKVDEFGMLIPFPTPPSIRKVPNNVFEQLAAAAKPPTVTVHVGGIDHGGFFGGGFGGGGLGGMMGMGMEINEDVVRVIREEAVGMYEVAVLEAGSARALQTWMREHQYVYPEGMESVCPDYIRDGWCFVAVKTKVRRKSASNPQPGQRAVSNAMPAEASFDGYVQAMGFRFRTREAVVPMRLSVFNSDDLHNVVYLLAEQPSTFGQLPKEMVTDQLPGERLLRNLSDPLPLEIIGGSFRDLTRQQRQGLAARRDPRPHNAVAGELIAEDLIAAETGTLLSRRELHELELLRISEELNLRGDELDRVIHDELERERRRVTNAALEGVRALTLTVIEGDFPRDVVAGENLTLADYRSPQLRADAGLGARAVNPHSPPTSAVAQIQYKQSSSIVQPSSAERESDPVSKPFLGGILASLLGCCGYLLRRRLMALAVIASVVAPTLLWTAVHADEPGAATRLLVRQLADRETAPDAVNVLVRRGEPAVAALIAQTKGREPLEVRGWAILGLGRIAGPAAVERLTELTNNPRESELVRNWAAAALVLSARNASDLARIANQLIHLPAVDRPVAVRYQEIAGDFHQLTAEQLIHLRQSIPQLDALAHRQLLALGAQPLLAAMLNAPDQRTRREAAGYLASFGSVDDRRMETAQALVRALEFDPQATAAPWAGGPLYIPQLRWPSQQAQQLICELISWSIWADRREDTQTRSQVLNNLQSVGLANAAGCQPPGGIQTVAAWLRVWSTVTGPAAVDRLLAEQRAESAYSWRP